MHFSFLPQPPWPGASGVISTSPWCCSALSGARAPGGVSSSRWAPLSRTSGSLGAQTSVLGWGVLERQGGCEHVLGTGGCGLVRVWGRRAAPRWEEGGRAAPAEPPPLPPPPSFMAPEDPPGSSRQVPGLGRFAVGTHIAFQFIFLFSCGGRPGWPAQLPLLGGGGGGGGGEDRNMSMGNGGARGHRGQRPLAFSHSGAAASRGRGSCRLRADRPRAHPPCTGPRHPSPPALTPTPRAGTRPSPSPLAPAAASARGARQGPRAPRRVPGGGRARAAGGLRRAPPPVAAWRLAPFWQPFSAAAAAGALRSETEAAAARQGRRGRAARRHRHGGGGVSRGPERSEGRAESPAPQPLPLLQCRRSGALRVASACDPTLSPPSCTRAGAFPKRSRGRQSLSPARGGPPAAHPAWAAWVPEAGALAPPLPGGRCAPPSRGGLCARRPLAQPQRVSDDPASTRVAGLDSRCHPPWLREVCGGASPAGAAVRQVGRPHFF